MANAILVNKKDNVVTAVADIKDGEDVIYMKGSDRKSVKAIEPISYGHKISISEISKGSSIIKYGEIVGTARANIVSGQWIHTHNTEETYLPSR